MNTNNLNFILSNSIITNNIVLFHDFAEQTHNGVRIGYIIKNDILNSLKWTYYNLDAMTSEYIMLDGEYRNFNDYDLFFEKDIYDNFNNYIEIKK